MTVLGIKDYMKLYDTNTSRLATRISSLMVMKDEGSEGISRQSIDNWIKDGTGVIQVNISTGDIITVKTVSTKVFFDRGE